jgi:hypothetical protein
VTWNYENRPLDIERDRIRFLVGDVDECDQLVTDEEIAFSASKFPDKNELAAAYILRALAAKFSRKASMSAGGVSASCSDIAKAFSDRAKELDPNDETSGGGTNLCEISVGGITISEHEAMRNESDTVQPAFNRGADDIPGGPGDYIEGYDPRIR